MWRDDSVAGAAVIEDAPPLQDRLDVRLSLRAQGQQKAVNVFGANVELVELALRSYGFRGRLRFWVLNDDKLGGDQPDEVEALLRGTAAVNVELALLPLHPPPERGGPKPRAITVKGVVTERQIFEQGFISAGAASVTRRYELEFLDPMSVYWGQHHPCQLYTKKKLSDVLTEHRGQLFTLTCNAAAATAERPLLFLGHDAGQECSFYDFLIWFTDSNQAVLSYDTTAGTYALADQKAATPRKGWLDYEDVTRIVVRLPELARYQRRVKNGDAVAHSTSATTATPAVSPIFQDILLREAVASTCQARLNRETKRLALRKDEIHMAFSRLPLVVPQPGDSVDLSKDPQWAAAGVAVPAAAKAEALRFVSIDLALRADAPAFSRRDGGHDAEFTGRMTATLEPLSEAHVSLPPYAPPPGERLVEGNVVSEIGTEKQETHDAVTEQGSSVDKYKVKIPLFANQIVNAPFEPGGQPGHFYFPAYRAARVLVGLRFDAARVVAFLDWRVDARLPKDQQGNQLLMGKAPDDSTALRLAYKENQPVFTLQRLNKKDRQTLELHEGGLRIEVREDKGQAS